MIIETMEQCMSNLALARSEIDRLRAENAELRAVAADLRNECYFMGKDVREADAILTKTAKEGE